MLGLRSGDDRQYVSAFQSVAGCFTNPGRSKVCRGFLFQAVSPYLLIANKAHDQMAKMLVEFGMTPSSCSSVTNAALGESKNQFADLVKGHRISENTPSKPKTGPSSIG